MKLGAGEKIALASLIVGIFACIGTYLTVPEVRAVIANLPSSQKTVPVNPTVGQTSPTTPLTPTQALTAPSPVPAPASTAAEPVATTPAVAPTRPSAPTATATPCSNPVSSIFAGPWKDPAIYGRLGCPAAIAVTRESVEETFQRGHMVWRGGGVQVYTIYSDGTWDLFPKNSNDILQASDPEYFCGVHSSPPSPRRGFSKIWCNNPDVRAKIGDATESEEGFCMPSNCETFQDFEGGTIYYSAKYKSTYILFTDRTWQLR